MGGEVIIMEEVIRGVFKRWDGELYKEAYGAWAIIIPRINTGQSVIVLRFLFLVTFISI
jgi:hypothetical protein